MRDDQELVRIDRHDPICRVPGDGMVAHEVRHALRQVLAGRRILDDRQGEPFSFQGAQDDERAVGAAVVEDHEMVHHGERVPDEGLDDVDLVLHGSDGHDLRTGRRWNADRSGKWIRDETHAAVDRYVGVSAMCTQA